ncbi:MAG: sulfatase-like hydrolase/transferase, partial [Verrucomicrobiota bacterium]
FVIIMADDLGAADLGCFGSETIKTPALDKLASEGARMTQFYVPAPSCSPSRAGMMTGRGPQRLGIYTYILEGTAAYLHADEVTFGKLLQAQGYDTCFVGKWGLNANQNFNDEPNPGDHGFDHWFATQNNSIPDHKDPETFVRNGEVLGTVEGYSCQLVVDEAIEWLDNREDKEKPFCLVVWTHEPHTKIASPEKFNQMYEGQGLTEQKALYNANVTHMDHHLGRLFNDIDQRPSADNTFTLFTSDNGAHRGDKNLAGDSGIYKGGKGMVYEGGVRMPTIVRWPAVLEAGADIDTPLSTVDILPTMCEITGADLPSGRALDGTSFWGHLKGDAFERKRPLYYMNPFYAALRKGDWKIVLSYENTADYDTMLGYFRNREFLGFDTKGKKAPELYNLADDISEQNNLVGQHPDIAKKMFDELAAISREVQKDMPDQPRLDFIPNALYLDLAEDNPEIEIPEKFIKPAPKK